MSAIVEELIRDVEAAGLFIRPEPPDLIVKPARKLRPDLERRLRECKAELLEHLRTSYTEAQLSDSLRRMEHMGVSIAVWEDGTMRVLISEGDAGKAMENGGTIYSPADMYHYIRLDERGRRMYHTIKRRFGGTTEWMVELAHE
jgi:hypothetical protein